MDLFYNHNWIPESVSISLLLVMVADAKEIKTFEQLEPYFY